MAFLPLTTTLIAVLFGVTAAARMGAGIEGEHVLTVVLNEIHQSSQLGRWLVVVLFSAILAALMSTADSVVLSLSSMVTKDFVAVARPNWSQRRLTYVGKICSWVVIAIAAAIAIRLRETGLVTLLKIKFELLTQLVPAFFLGLHWRRAKASPVLAGMLVGVAIALLMVLVGTPKPFGIHAGLYGLVANLAVAVVGSVIIRSTTGHR
jgi:SSS family solute:Na+ symporter/sodium/pantothenate symporter